MRRSVSFLLVPFLLLVSEHGAAAGQPPRPAAAGPLIPVVWLEPAQQGPGQGAAGSGQRRQMPIYTVIPATDPRVHEGEKLLDNEPARFTRRLLAWAFRTFGSTPDWPDARLPIVLEKGGNYARTGFRLLAGGKIEEHAGVPFIILELDAGSLSDTLLHEGGHMLHSVATRGRRAATDWSAVLHTTFAVTDPLTAVSEGYAIHFETLLGHYGSDPGKRAYYHRIAPAFDLKGSRRAEFYAPVTDLMTFSQSWARYQAVRETWPAFAGHVYPGDYLRSQYDPARDRAVLKPANAMVASEGVVASVLFWTSAGLADAAGAKFGEGLEQPGLVEAEETLLRALSALPAKDGFRPDLVDFVSAIGTPGSAARRIAVSRFVSVTRGVTARPEIRAKWTALYRDAIGLDFEGTRPIFAELDTTRDAIVEAALADPASLRRGLGPVLPVRCPKAMLELKALEQKFPLEFDLNASTEAEWLAAGLDAATRARVLDERDRAPFASVADFEKRTAKTLQALGLEVVTPEGPPDETIPAATRSPLLLPADAPELNRTAPDVFRVRLDTTAGVIVIEVHRAWAPHGADRFYNLVANGYYDGSRFYRVIKDKWAQFGISATPEIASLWRTRAIPDDPRVESNTRGTVAFAFAVPNGRTTQVFINLRDNSPTHDKEPFVPFGRVVEGMAAADALYSDYGETSGGGIRAGRQDPLFQGGSAYLEKNFPLLSIITKATIEPHR